MPAQLVRADLERHPRPGRALPEDHGQGKSGEGRARLLPARLQVHGSLQQSLELGSAEVIQGQEVPLGLGRHVVSKSW